jgi:hypothetical protein
MHAGHAIYHHLAAATTQKTEHKAPEATRNYEETGTEIMNDRSNSH